MKIPPNVLMDQGVLQTVRLVCGPGDFPNLDLDGVPVLISIFGPLDLNGLHDWHDMPV